MKRHVYRTMSEGELSEKEVLTLATKFENTRKHHFRRLEKYYETRNVGIAKTVAKRAQELKETDSKSPNNMVVNSYAKYITDTQVGYFMGKPVAYTLAEDGDEGLLEKLTDIFDRNDEQTENMELAKIASVNGLAFELLYTDENGMPRFKAMDPDEMFCVYDSTVEEKIVCAVRSYKQKTYDDSEVHFIQVYDRDKVRYFQIDARGFHLEREEPHYWKDVPVAVYDNNAESIGDFEPVLSLIDAYDKEQSNTLNDMEQFTDAYLMLMNYSGTTSKEIDDMKKNRVLLLDENGNAAWLVKNINDAWIENFKTRIQNDIHKFAATPDMSDENFGNNASGVSLSYKLLGMEQTRATKERYFRKGLQRRMMLLCNLPSVGGDYTTIDMQFNNALPQNILELSQIIGNLSNILSEETLLSLLPFISDPAAEIEKREAETDNAAAANYDQLMGLQPHVDQPQELEETTAGNEEGGLNG